MNDSAWAFISAIALATGFIIGIAVGSKRTESKVEKATDIATENLQARVDSLEKANESCFRERTRLKNELAESQQKYQELSYKYHDSEFEKAAAESAYPSDEDDLEPYEISETEFEHDFNSDDCDSTSLNYYVEDMIFTDEKDEKFSEPEEFLGEENVEMFNKMTVDDFRQVVYIRNPSSNTVYEVIVENEIGYYRDILGINDGLDDD